MAGNPSWWGMHIHDSSLVSSSSSSSSSSPVYGSIDSSSDTVYALDHLPVRSWSQFLLGGGGGYQQEKKLEIWEDQVVNLSPCFTRVPFIDVKQELMQSTIVVDRQLESWRQQLPVSSSSSFVINSALDFSGDKMAVSVADGGVKSQKQSKSIDHHSSEKSNTNATIAADGASKKARFQHSSPQPALKVRKEKLGDRITALHQLVCPFGKTDTASVLSEAIGYIRFLQTQVEALSSPYMRNQHPVHERSCFFSEDGGQDSRRGLGEKDLRSRGLCLVPISCTQHVGNDTGADYWAPSSLGGGF